MIVRTERPLPADWTDDDLRELIAHARDLSMHGNLAGWFLLRSVETLPDVESLRTWVMEHTGPVRTAWQFEVRLDP